MNTTDWTHWPLLHISALDIPAADLPSIVGAALRTALDRDEPFAAVVEPPGMPARRGRGKAAVAQVRMLRQLRPGLVQRCRGLAFVMSADSIRENSKVVRSGPKIWGCPVAAFDDVAQARAWAQGQLQESSPADRQEP